MSYLPLAHIYERVTMLVCLFRGAGGFFRGDVLGCSTTLQAQAHGVLLGPASGTVSTIKCRRAFARVGS